MLLGISIFFVTRSYIGHKYGYVPSAEQLEAYRKQLQERARLPDPPIKAEEIDKEVLACLYEAFAQYAALNSQSNDRKTRFLFTGNLFIILALVAIFISGATAVLTTLSEAPAVHRVMIVD